MKLVYYPFLINISGKRLLFVGGAQVARRKISALLPMEPRICVIAPRIDAELRTLASAGTTEIVEREAQEDDLEHCDYAFLCTDNWERNATLAARGKELRVSVTVHTDEDAGLVISVSTQGKSPSLARRLRDRIGELLHKGELS